MHLFLVQHGEAKAKDVDPDRRLTDQGVRDVETVAAFLRPMNLKVQTIWHSGKSRAEQTARILTASISAYQCVIQQDKLNPNDPVSESKAAIETFDGDLMIVGHLPFLSKLASLLIAEDEEVNVVAFQYGAVVCLQKNKDDGWTIAWMIVPAALGA